MNFKGKNIFWCDSISKWVIVSDLEIAIASPSFASLFITKKRPQLLFFGVVAKVDQVQEEPIKLQTNRWQDSLQPRTSSARPLAGHLTDVTLASEDGQLVAATRWSCLGRVPFSRRFLKIETSSSFGLYQRTDYGWMDKGEKDIFMIHTKRTWTRSSRGIEWNDWSTQTSGGSKKISIFLQDWLW